MTGATDKAAWVDMTNSTPLEVARDVVHFSTKVSALFWILVIHDSSRDPESALTLANRLYEVNCEPGCHHLKVSSLSGIYPHPLPGSNLCVLPREFPPSLDEHHQGVLHD